MDMSKFAQSESSDLKAADFVGKNLKVTISAVEVRHFEARDNQPATDKPALRFEGKEKALILNTTNARILCDAYGDESEGWIGKSIGLSVADYTSKGFGHGWVVHPLDVAPPEFDDDIPW